MHPAGRAFSGGLVTGLSHSPLAKFGKRAHLHVIVNSAGEVIQLSHQKSSVSKGLGSLRFLTEQPLS
jgi:hypothetical protein